MKTHISVIIPAHNEEKYIKRCMDSIKAADQRFPGNTEIIVVCNRCTDQTGSIASSLQRHLKEKYSLTLDELQILDTIYIVEISGKKFISDINDEQQKLLDKLQIGIEANSDQ